MARCASCGEELNQGAPFCGNCGSAIGETAPVQSQPQPLEQVESPKAPVPKQERSLAVVEGQKTASTPAPVPVIMPVSPGPKRERRPANYAPLLLGGVVFAVIVGAIYILMSGKTNGTQVPVFAPSSPVAAQPAPVIAKLTADPPQEKDGAWFSIIHWEIRNAKSAELTAGNRDDDDVGIRESIDPTNGSKEIPLSSYPTMATISASNEAGKIENTISCGVQGATSEPTATSSSAPDTPSVPTPQIEEFEVSLRNDTSIGSAIRVAYKLPANTGVSLTGNDSALHLDPQATYGDYFVTRRTHFVLKVETASGELNKEIDVSPDPKVAHEPERQEIGPPLGDVTDLVSLLAMVVDFNRVAEKSLDDTLCGWLNEVFRGATVEDLGHFRNAIFARNGYLFKRPELQRYFGARSWYKGDSDSSEAVNSRLNSVEKRNVTWLLDREKASPAKP